ncbi:unnamed protein product [Coffea canephora]|uniref:Uncharacterized protein n=1 Tax=Coffea canephora TaxID=49390 RepID=A0A068TTH3_COFCA|nr:unnamed protein product [Coffea canephora]
MGSKGTFSEIFKSFCSFMCTIVSNSACQHAWPAENTAIPRKTKNKKRAVLPLRTFFVGIKINSSSYNFIAEFRKEEGIAPPVYNQRSPSYLQPSDKFSSCLYVFNKEMSRIDEKLSELLDTSEKPSIFKIHGQLRSENEEAYEPQVVSIGPYHHGKPKLKEMEKHKLRYFNELLRRRGESSAEKYIIALADLQDQARRYYAEEINLTDVDFVDMLCLDGCFVIEFLRKRRRPGSHWENDPIFQMLWLRIATKNDLILFENQLPFFALLQLFDMTKSPGEEENLIDLAIHFSLSFGLADPGLNSHSTIFEHYKPVHLLGLVHKILSASFSETLTSTTYSNTTRSSLFLKSAGELRQSGIKFEKAADGKSSFHITFENGVLKIPPLVVHDNTESFFRNLIACEEYMSNPIETWKCVTDYILFIDCLIDSPSDVETLRRHDIIVNGLGSDEAASTMFNKLTNHVQFFRRFCYTKIFDDVDKYTRKRWHIWRANLVRKYFNTPWAFISVLAACALLLLTSVQAIFSILQYTKQNWRVLLNAKDEDENPINCRERVKE